MAEVVKTGGAITVKVKTTGPPGATVASGVTVTEVATLTGTDVQTALENLAARLAILEP